MFEDQPSLNGPEDIRIQDAVEMEPWSFCSKYNGKMGDTENLWYVSLESISEHYVWRKENTEFQGLHKGDSFSPDFIEKMEVQQKRIEAGIKSGELVPDISGIRDKTAEEFAKENEVDVNDGPSGSKTVVLDDAIYIWGSDGKFVGVQVVINLYDEEDSAGKESETSDKLVDENDIPSEGTIKYLIKAIRLSLDMSITREEAIQLYYYIKKNGGDIDSCPPFPFLGG